MSALLAWAVMTTCIVGPVDLQLSLPELVEAHMSAVGGIHEIEFELDLTGERFVPKHVGPLRIATWHWAWKGERERVRYVDHKVERRDDGLTNNCGDGFVDGTTFKLLLNWDPDHPQKITPRRQGTCVARTGPENGIMPGRDAKNQLLWVFNRPSAPAVRHSLAELVADSVPPATLEGTMPIAGHECWHVHAHLPGVGSNLSGGTNFDIFIDPTVNFFVRQVEKVQKLAPSNGGEGGEVHMVREVKEFAGFDKGVFVPLKVETRFYEQGGSKAASIMTAKVSKIVVNRPISPNAFDFIFPENVQVVHSPENGKARVQLWGRDNKPIRDINSPADLLGDGPQPNEAVRWSRGRYVAILGAIVGAILLSVILIWRKRQE